MIGKRILIVEDEAKTAQQIKRGLEEDGLVAEIAYDGLEGKNKFLSGTFNLVILDLNLPVINGFDLCFFMRNNNPGVPIIMLTALGEMDDKLSGFDAGADDYMVKPFEFLELLARIKVMLKRAVVLSDQEQTQITIEDLFIDTSKMQVTRAGKKIQLTSKEFALLEFLARNQGKVLTRAEIAEKVWDISFDTGTNVIDVFITFLRKKIDKGYSPKLIHTVYGTGFVLRAEEEEK
jgi:two-component system, OmpR family, copper resistance phosphate regulon response regulator CusR